MNIQKEFKMNRVQMELVATLLGYLEPLVKDGNQYLGDCGFCVTKRGCNTQISLHYNPNTKRIELMKEQHLLLSEYKEKPRYSDLKKFVTQYLITYSYNLGDDLEVALDTFKYIFSRQNVILLFQENNVITTSVNIGTFTLECLVFYNKEGSVGMCINLLFKQTPIGVLFKTEVLSSVNQLQNRIDYMLEQAKIKEQAKRTL